MELSVDYGTHLHRRKVMNELKRLRDMQNWSTEIQRDHDRERQAMGLPLQFIPIALYGSGVTPLTIAGSGNLQSWHVANRGISLGAQLIPTGVTPPVCSFTADITQSVPFSMHATSTGARGTATYGMSIDGGATYFQTGTTAVTVPVPLFGAAATVQMGTGTFTILDKWVAVVNSITNQTSKIRALNSLGTDSQKPVLVPAVLNNYPGIKKTVSGMIDTSSQWAADVANGSNVSFSVFGVAKWGNAIPGATGFLFGFSNNTDADPCWQFGNLNTNVWLIRKANDTGTQTQATGGAIVATPIYFSIVQNAGAISMWINGVQKINAVTLSNSPTALNNVSLFGSTRGTTTAISSLIATDSYLLQIATYNAAFISGSNLSATGLVIESYMKNKYAL